MFASRSIVIDTSQGLCIRILRGPKGQFGPAIQSIPLGEAISRVIISILSLTNRTWPEYVLLR